MSNRYRAARQNNLTTHGGTVPKWVRCYVDGGQSIDRYTIVFPKRTKVTGGVVRYVAMTENPAGPSGFFEQGGAQPGELVEGKKKGDCPVPVGQWGNLGRRIAFEELPLEVRRVVWREYAHLWDLEVPRGV